MVNAPRGRKRAASGKHRTTPLPNIPMTFEIDLVTRAIVRPIIEPEFFAASIALTIYGANPEVPDARVDFGFDSVMRMMGAAMRCVLSTTCTVRYRRRVASLRVIAGWMAPDDAACLNVSSSSFVSS